MTLHTIKPERRTLHGHFSKDLPPALTIEPGDTVRFQTLDAGWGARAFRRSSNLAPAFWATNAKH